MALYSGDSDPNLFTGTGESDSVSGDSGNDALWGAGGNDTVDGGSDQDLVYGGVGNDLGLGGLGDDSLDGGLGSDTLEGGAGDDTYTIDQAGDLIVEAEDGGIDLVRSRVSQGLAESLEHLSLAGTAVSATGNGKDNRLRGNRSDNTLSGEAGNDTLAGGAGADTLAGGSGDDTYVVHDGLELIVELGSEGNDRVRSSTSFTLGANLENLVLIDPPRVLLYRNDFDGHERLGEGVSGGLSGVLGTAGVQGFWVDGFAGNLLHNDQQGDPAAASLLTLSGLPAHRALDIDFRLAFIDSWDGSDPTNPWGPDLFNLTLDGSTLMQASALWGSPDLLGHGGLPLGGSEDRGFNPSYPDQAFDMTPDPQLAPAHTAAGLVIALYASGAGWQGSGDESWGIDDLKVWATPVTPSTDGTGNWLDNAIAGSRSANRLDGQAGADTLRGGMGDDTLIGGLGHDRLSGGDGADRFRFEQAGGGAGRDRLTDFESGIDRIEVLSANFGGLPIGTLDGSRLVAAGTPLAGGEAVLVYDQASGMLAFDPDGNGAQAAVAFARIGGAGTLVAGDIEVVAA
jgi:Ca2+-binding RTX toxin-like protein